MTYATRDMVKDRLGIPFDETERDAQIDAGLTYADGRCDEAMLEAHGSTPVSSPPQGLQEAAADFAAYFLLRSDNSSSAELFLNSAENLLKQYVNRALKGGGAALTGKHGVRDED